MPLRPASARRAVATAILAAGALASIATSPVQPWLLEEYLELTGGPVGPGQPALAYRLRIEAVGVDDPAGAVVVELSAAPAAGADAAGAGFVATLVDDADPALLARTTYHAADGASPSPLALEWNGCDASPCVATYTLSIEAAADATAALDVTGSLQVTLHGSDGRAEAPSGADLRVSLTPLGAE